MMISRTIFTLTGCALALTLAGCASTVNSVAPNYIMPHQSKNGLMALAYVCRGHKNNALEKALAFGNQYPLGSLTYGSVAGGFGNSDDIAITCDNKVRYYLSSMPAGKYTFSNLSIGDGDTGGMNINFSIQPQKVTYIGRLVIDAAAATTSFGGKEEVSYQISPSSAVDLAYFKKTYKNIPSRYYRVDYAVLTD